VTTVLPPCTRRKLMSPLYCTRTFVFLPSTSFHGILYYNFEFKFLCVDLAATFQQQHFAKLEGWTPTPGVTLQCTDDLLPASKARRRSSKTKVVVILVLVVVLVVTDTSRTRYNYTYNCERGESDSTILLDLVIIRLTANN
jgi:hypothetical protein